jgi:hypothetical protein
MSHEVFDRVAEAYDAARPGYPDGLHGALAALSSACLVVYVGADGEPAVPMRVHLQLVRKAGA